MRNLSVLFLALCSTALCLPAFAADGEAVGVDPSATAQTQTVERVLIHGSDISVGDRIVTSPSGEVQILFSEGTRLVVGHNSALVVEQYLLRNANSADAVAVDALSGTFRFITGSSPHEAYEITTPTGTIGVRGTAFDFYSAPDLTIVVLFNGAVELCSNSGQCVVLSNPCEIGTISASGVSVIGPNDPVREDLEDDFPYIQSQIGLRRPFRVADADACLEQRPTIRVFDRDTFGNGSDGILSRPDPDTTPTTPPDTTPTTPPDTTPTTPPDTTPTTPPDTTPTTPPDTTPTTPPDTTPTTPPTTTPTTPPTTTPTTPPTTTPTTPPTTTPTTPTNPLTPGNRLTF